MDNIITVQFDKLLEPRELSPIKRSFSGIVAPQNWQIMVVFFSHRRAV